MKSEIIRPYIVTCHGERNVFPEPVPSQSRDEEEVDAIPGKPKRITSSDQLSIFKNNPGKPAREAARQAKKYKIVIFDENDV